MSTKVTNNAYSQLASGISNSATTIVLTTGTGTKFPSLTPGIDRFWGTLQNAAGVIEVVKVTAVSTDTLTVVRGQDNTTAVAWNAGDRFELRPTAALFNDKLDIVDSNTALALKGTVAGQIWTGTHDFSGAAEVKVPTPTASSDAVTKAYADALSFASVLPNQSGNNGLFVTTNGTTASWAPIPTQILNGYISGFTLSNDGTSPNTVLDIAPGVASNSTNAVMIKGTTFTKSTTGSWTAGTGNGGMGTGLTVTPATWYHVFAIIKDGVFDVYFDTSIAATNAPSGTTYYRYIGSFRTAASTGYIIPFTQVGQYITYATAVGDINNGTATSATLVTLTVPPGLSVIPLINFGFPYGAVGALYANVWSGLGGQPNILTSVFNPGASSNSQAVTNTSAQIYYINSSNTYGLYLNTSGYINPKLSPFA